MRLSLSTMLLPVMLLFIFWSAWLLVSPAVGPAPADPDSEPLQKLENLERELLHIREASATVSAQPSPESLERWMALWYKYRNAVSQIPKTPGLVNVTDQLTESTSFITRAEKIRQSLIAGGQTPAEASALEAEFRSDINLALAAIREAELRVRTALTPVPKSRDTASVLYIVSALLLALCAGLALMMAGRPTETVGQPRTAASAEDKRFDCVTDTIADGVLELDDDGSIRFANAAVERLFGYDPDELVGHGLRLLVPQASGDLRGSDAGSVIGRRKDGTEFALDMLMRRAGTGPGSVLFTFFRERRPQLEPAAALSQRLDLLAKLSGRFAHNFNNLLTAINGYTDLLLQTVSDDHPLRKELEEIQKAGNRAATLTTQLLAISGNQMLYPEVFNLNALIKEVAAALPPLLGPNIVVKTALDPSLGSIRMDRTQLERTLLNLAVNARDAMPQGGTLTIESANFELDASSAKRFQDLPAGVYTVIDVRDTGEGMDEATLAHLFEPFYTTKKHGTGMGLSLASAYGVIRQSGGVIRVWSQPGQGSVFQIYLPHAPKAMSATPEPTRGSSGTVPPGPQRPTGGDVPSALVVDIPAKSPAGHPSSILREIPRPARTRVRPIQSVALTEGRKKAGRGR